MFHDHQRKFRSAVVQHPVGDAVRPAVPGAETCPAMIDPSLMQFLRSL